MNRAILRSLLSLLVAASAMAEEPDSPPIVVQSLPAVGNAWVAQGAAPMQNGQTEGLTNNPVVGAVNAIVAHPSNADIVWAASVNGGIWKTTSSTNASPTWTPQSDAASSLSIGAMKLDPTDATNNTLVAGTGSFSSFGGRSGPLGVLLRTTNGGTTWTELNPSLLAGKNISGVAPRGATIVMSAKAATVSSCSNYGIFRSVDTGATFTMISGAGGTGLPLGRAYDLAGDPTNSATLYTALANCNSGAGGIYKSTDTGATWSKVSNATMDALLADAAGVNNVKIAVGASGQIYVAIADSGVLAGLFRSGNGGSTWTQLDTPKTSESGGQIGIHPGHQASYHFSLVADPTDANIVYIGGDRQPLGGDGASSPNAIGASNYTGRVFRVNAAAGAGSQSTPLTHCKTATAACNSTVSTSNGSAPHADSRALAIDASGNVLEGDDGGIYRRTNPRTTGDWFSMNGTLQVTEMHDIVYDRVSNMLLSGNQDTGTCEQTSENGTVWNEVFQGDGGDVSCDDDTSATQSTRYNSYQGLGAFQRRTVNTSGTTTSTVYPTLTVLSGGASISPQFVTPVESNRVAPTRILFAASNDLYESLDRGDTVTALGFGTATAMVYGGRASGVDNLDLIYAIYGTGVYVRTSGSGAPLLTAASPGTANLRDVAVDPTDWHKAYVVNDSGQVWSTTNNGGSWTNVTGNLGSGTADLRTLVVVIGAPGSVVAGGTNGVFRMATDNPGVWNQLGTGLPNAIVHDLDYDAADDTLVAGTLGRGAWKLTPVNEVGNFPSLSIGNASVTEGNSGSTNAVFTVTLTPSVAWTTSVSYATANGSATSGSSAPFTNSSSITIPDSGYASPYPSNITVAGLTGTISKVTATINSFGHTYTSDVDVLLVGPAGQTVILMSDVGSSSNLSGVNVTFDDSAVSTLPTSSFGSGTYKPTNIGAGDTWGSPAPAGPYGTALSVFNGTAPNGTWQLYVIDDAGGDTGAISGGWSLTITSTGGDYVAKSGAVTFSPGETSKTITIAVNGDATVEANETFFVNLSSPASAVIADGQGEGTILNDDGGLQPPANVVASATTTTNILISWTAAAGASTYRVYRSSGGGSYTLAGEMAGTSLNDGGRAAGTSYLYKVRSFNGSESPDSERDLATTVLFTDPSLVAGTTEVKAVHVMELLTAVNAVLTLAAQPAITLPPTPAVGVAISRQHILNLRSGLDTARSILSLSAPLYTDLTVTSGSTLVKAAHLNELRTGVQ
jgi:subtilisin-like proprotein convertase family protein